FSSNVKLVLVGTPVAPYGGAAVMICGTTGLEAWMVKPLVTVSVPSVGSLMLTLYAPSVAPAAMARLAVALVGLLTEIGPAVPAGAPPTETNGPKLAVVWPPWKLVNAPLMVTVWFEFCTPTFRAMLWIVATPGSTWKALPRVAISAPVVTVTV